MKYDKQEILGLKLRAATGLRRLNRGEFLSRRQLLPVIDRLTEQAYDKVERETWRKQLDDSPHGQKWNVSFHASQFPGVTENSCPRQALYRMSDFAPAEPFNRHARSVMSAGKAIETELVRVYDRAGFLLSSDNPEEQTNFEDREAWLTGSTDIIVAIAKAPVPVEVKTKYQADLDAMRNGERGPDSTHVSQVKVETAMVRAAQMNDDPVFKGLELCNHGRLYYLSRDRPSCTAEFRVDYDEAFYQAGRELLKQWKQHFIDDALPSINPSKKHPMGWHWTKQPCKWCTFKKGCQTDHKAGIETLSESSLVEQTEDLRRKYSFEAARREVFERWPNKTLAKTARIR